MDFLFCWEEFDELFEHIDGNVGFHGSNSMGDQFVGLFEAGEEDREVLGFAGVQDRAGVEVGVGGVVGGVMVGGVLVVGVACE